MTPNAACIIKVTLMSFLYQSEFKSRPLTFPRAEIFQEGNGQTYPYEYLSADEHPKFKTSLGFLVLAQPGCNCPANRAHIKSSEVSRLETGIVEKADKLKNNEGKNNYRDVQNHIFISGRSSVKEKFPVLSSLLYLSFLYR